MFEGRMQMVSSTSDQQKLMLQIMTSVRIAHASANSFFSWWRFKKLQRKKEIKKKKRRGIQFRPFLVDKLNHSQSNQFT